MAAEDGCWRGLLREDAEKGYWGRRLRRDRLLQHPCNFTKYCPSMPLPRKVTMQLHQILRLPRKMTLQLHCTLPWLNSSLTGPFVDGTLPWWNSSLSELLLNWTVPSLKYSFTENDWTMPWPNHPLTELFLDSILITWNLFHEWSISIVLKLRNSESCSKLPWTKQLWG